jgi:predicted Zn-dependent protease
MMSNFRGRHSSVTLAVPGRSPRRWVRLCGAFVAAYGCSLPPPAFAHPEIEIQVAHVSSAIARSPENAELFLQRGQLYREHRDWSKALLDFRQAATLDPRLHRVERAIGRLYLDADQPEAAMGPLQRFLDQEPGDPEGLLFRGRALARTGSPLKAADDFDAALPKWSRPTPELFIERSQFLVAAGEPSWARALLGLEEGIAKLGDLYTLQRSAAELEIASGHSEAALRRVRALIAKSNGHLNWQILEAELLVSLGHAGEARSSYRLALDKIIALPSHRRGTPTVANTERQIRSALEKLGSGP